MPAEQTKHIRNPKYDYELADGTKVPGVTTIVRLRHKELKHWAFNIGKQNPGLRSIEAYSDDLARIGTCGHLLVTSHLMGKDPDLDDFTRNEIKGGERVLKKYLRWAQGKVVVPHSVEEQVISERHRYGGTLDVYAVVDGLFTVADIKTGKAIYKEHIEQDAAYAEAKKENGAPVDQLLILQLGRTEDEGFSEKPVRDWRNPWMHFLTLRQLYDIEKANEKGEVWIPPKETPFVLLPDPMLDEEAWQTKHPQLRLVE